MRAALVVIHATTTTHAAWSFSDHGCPGIPRPRLAACIVGNLRTFYDPRVHESIRHNFLDAFGANTTVFVGVKAADAIKPEAVEKMKVSELREALAARGLESTGLKKELVERLQKALGA